MVANHYGETGEYGDFGEFGELLSNRQMYVNQFHTWWPAMLAKLANMALQSAPHVFSFNCYLHFSSMWNQQSIFSLTSHHLCNCNGDFICIGQKCPTCVIHLFPYLPRFDQFFSNVRATNTYIYFHVKNFFPDVLLHDLPSSLYNRNVYREDKLQLTKKGNDILTEWFHYCISKCQSPS